MKIICGALSPGTIHLESFTVLLLQTKCVKVNIVTFKILAFGHIGFIYFSHGSTRLIELIKVHLVKLFLHLFMEQVSFLVLAFKTFIKDYVLQMCLLLP